METISWSKAATVPVECHRIGAKSAKDSLFLESSNKTTSLYRVNTIQKDDEFSQKWKRFGHKKSRFIQEIHSLLIINYLFSIRQLHHKWQQFFNTTIGSVWTLGRCRTSEWVRRSGWWCSRCHTPSSFEARNWKVSLVVILTLLLAMARHGQNRS